MPSTQRHPTLQVLQRPLVRRFSIAQLCSTLAFSLLRATVAWHIWKLTGSYALLGTLGLVEFLPVIPISLLGGAVADSHDRSYIATRSLFVSVLLSCALCGSTARGLGELPTILGVTFLLAVSNAFQRPAMSALLPTLVPTQLFPTATVVNANVRNTGLVGGPVLMGFVTQQVGIAGAYGLCALLFLGATFAMLRFPATTEQVARQPVSWSSIRLGIEFVRSQPALLSSMVLDMFAVIFAGATAMLPVFADEILHVDALGYGLLSASMQIGTLIAAIALLIAPPLARPGRALLWAVVVFGACTVVFGLSRSFHVSVAAFIIAGIADQVSMTSRSIISQLSTPNELRGRVSSVSMIFIGASNELGAAESGYLAALTSATFSVVFGGVACLFVVAAMAAKVPSLRSYTIPVDPQ